MLKFDKIKLVTNIDNVKITNNDVFDSIIRDGVVVSQKFHQESPYLIMMYPSQCEKAPLGYSKDGKSRETFCYLNETGKLI